MEYLIGFTISGLIGYLIGKPKGAGGFGFIVSVLLGPIGWLIIAIHGGNLKKCPNCAERVKPEATVCRFCQSKLRPVFK